ncbi:MAG TPA: hypothetical protein EYP14_13850, partial [Planctomycetaceae bacterium]|nr:hypothetical protein [Planctomycetaceae bacterium]
MDTAREHPDQGRLQGRRRKMHTGPYSGRSTANGDRDHCRRGLLARGSTLGSAGSREPWTPRGLSLLVAIIAFALRASSAEDWPTYRHDIARSGVTGESLELPLRSCWVFQARHAPEPAWGEPKPKPVEGILELPRVRFDDAYHVVVAGDRAFFGTSSDNAVFCLDVATGRILWKRLVNGPVRLAPTVWNGRVYVGSDDGWVYCFRASDGAVVWKLRAAPHDRKVLGHGKLISLWPVRTGVLVDDGVAYFAAGIFPGEGVFFYAVRADTGDVIWRDGSASEVPQSRISPQGYLLASRDRLYAPMGRSSPAAIDRKTGRLLYTAYFGKTIGGTYALLADNSIFTGTEQMIAYRQDSPGARFAWFAGRRLIVTPDHCYMVTDHEMSSLDRRIYGPAGLRRQSLFRQRDSIVRQLRTPRRELAEAKRKLEEARVRLQNCAEQLQQATETSSDESQVAKLRSQCQALRKKVTAAERAVQSARSQVAKLEGRLKDVTGQIHEAETAMGSAMIWRRKCSNSDAFILAGGMLSAGGPGEVEAVAAETGQRLWAAEVEGRAKGLAVASGRLFVSTDTGAIYCFGPAGLPQHGRVTEPTTDAFAGQGAAACQKAVEQILRRTDVRRGYCLVLGLETGRLALELARRTELMIYAVDPDAQTVAEARKALDAAGLFGTRVCVEQWPLNRVPYANYFANLIVSETTVLTGELPP